jgi:tetratricopeptide (TPR) repeat protein
VRIFQGLAAVLLFGFTACADSAQDIKRRADDLLFTRKYVEAARVYENALIETSERRDAEAIELRGAVLAKLGELRHLYLNDPQGALRAYRAAADLSPGTSAAFDSRLAVIALLRDRLNDPAAAANELAALIASFPERDGEGKLRMEHAQLAFRAGRYHEALTSAQQVGKGNDVALKIEAATLIASIHEVEGRTQEALKTYEGMLEMPLGDPLASNIRFEIAHCHEALGDLEGALQHYELAKEGSMNAALIDQRMQHVQARMNAAHAPHDTNKRQGPIKIASRQLSKSLSQLRQD